MAQTNDSSPIAVSRRQRLRIACEPCRERKRKCDGNEPCSFCSGYQYHCVYRTKPRNRKGKAANLTTQDDGRSRFSETSMEPLDTPQTVNVPVSRQSDTQQSDSLVPETQTPLPRPNPRSEAAYLRQADSNPGAAFARALTLALDPSHHEGTSSPMRMPAWNLFLGERRSCESAIQPLPAGLTAILTKHEMQRLLAIYVDKVHPCYNFVPLSLVQHSVVAAWEQQQCSAAEEAVLCVVGALASLFLGTTVLRTELTLEALAKKRLDPATADRLSLQSAVAWLLLTVYLRLTALPEEAWLASCTTLHVIDAAGLHSAFGQAHNSASVATDDPDDHTKRRIIGVAQHLNVWMSYDLGRSRVALHGMKSADGVDSEQHDSDYTEELLGLLPYTHTLDPANSTSYGTLSIALADVLARNHTQPPSILAQCNVMLCIHRRLHALSHPFPAKLIANVLDLIRRAMQAVRECLAIGLPWHQVSNMPFQAICTLLALDNPQSFALLSDALSCLGSVNDVYQTAATREAVTAAHALLQLHRKRREADLRRHDEMLKLYPVSGTSSGEPLTHTLEPDIMDSWWLNEFIADANFDLGQSFDLE